MPLKAVLENLDDVDEAHRNLYVESNGSYILDIEDGDSFKNHPLTKPLSVALDRTQIEAKKVKEKNAAYESKIAELEKAQGDTGLSKAEQAELQRLREERDTLAKENEAIKGDYRKVTIGSKIDAAIRDAGIPAEYAEDARFAIERKYQIEFENGDAFVNAGSDGLFPADAFVKRWAGSEGSRFVSKPSGGGAGGSKGGGAGAQKKPEEMNVHERGQLLKDDPEAFYKAFPHAKLR